MFGVGTQKNPNRKMCAEKVGAIITRTKYTHDESRKNISTKLPEITILTFAAKKRASRAPDTLNPMFHRFADKCLTKTFAGNDLVWRGHTTGFKSQKVC